MIENVPVDKRSGAGSQLNRIQCNTHPTSARVFCLVLRFQRLLIAQILPIAQGYCGKKYRLVPFALDDFAKGANKN